MSTIQAAVSAVNQSISGLSGRVEGLERRVGELRGELQAHGVTDREGFEECRARADDLLKEIHELKVTLAEALAVEQDLTEVRAEQVRLREEQIKLQLTQAGQKPWFTMALEFIKIILGALILFGLLQQVFGLKH